MNTTHSHWHLFQQRLSLPLSKCETFMVFMVSLCSTCVPMTAMTNVSNVSLQPYSSCFLLLFWFSVLVKGQGWEMLINACMACMARKQAFVYGLHCMLPRLRTGGHQCRKKATFILFLSILSLSFLTLLGFLLLCEKRYGECRRRKKINKNHLHDLDLSFTFC